MKFRESEPDRRGRDVGAIRGVDEPWGIFQAAADMDGSIEMQAQWSRLRSRPRSMRRS